MLNQQKKEDKLLLTQLLKLLEPLTKESYKKILAEELTPAEQEARDKAIIIIANLYLGNPAAKQIIIDLIQGNTAAGVDYTKLYNC